MRRDSDATIQRMTVQKPNRPSKSKTLAHFSNREKALFEEVVRRPLENTPREILADFWQEQGNPLGEFVALQLKRGENEAPSERESSLLKKHRKLWLGELKQVLDPTSEFRRGFLAVPHFLAKVRHNNAAARRLISSVHSDPNWNTIEELPDGDWLADHLLEHASLPGLRRVYIDDSSLPLLEKRSEAMPGVDSIVIQGQHNGEIVPFPAAMLNRLFPSAQHLQVVTFASTLPKDISTFGACAIPSVSVSLVLDEGAEITTVTNRLIAGRAWCEQLEFVTHRFGGDKPKIQSFVRGKTNVFIRH
jgi:uncharacterized protein (TIGR02996 family)